MFDAYPSTSTEQINDLLNNYSSYSGVSDAAAAAGIWAVIAAVLAIVGGILVYFLFVKGKTEPKGKFAKWLKDFLAFKTMWIEAIVKVLYYIGTIFAILVSFAFISTSFVSFLLCLVLGPVLIRLVYEGVIMFIMVWRNTSDIAKNTKK